MEKGRLPGGSVVDQPAKQGRQESIPGWKIILEEK